MIISNTLVAFFFTEAIVAVLFIFSLYFAVTILKDWDFHSNTPYQYTLEKRDYFISLVLFFTLTSKIVLLPFFINLLNALSEKIPGAMCAAGVVSANEYGQILLLLKIILIFVGGIWLFLNAIDKKEKQLPFIMPRYKLFLMIFFLIVLEGVIEYLYFTNINTDEVVLCCSAIYGVNSNGLELPFGMGTQEVLILFYLLFILLWLSFAGQYHGIFTLSNVIFLLIAFYALTYFFSTYVYELPTHKCPYCLFQKEYFYVGYLFWGSLIAGVFFAIVGYSVSQISSYQMNHLYKISILCDTIFVALCTGYVAIYYLRNGVFL